MKYVLSAGEDEHGPLIHDSQDSQLLVFTSHALACEAAKMLVKGRQGEGGLPEGFGVFVHKLVATAFYFPIVNENNKAVEPFVDETQVFPNKDHDKGPDGRDN